MGIASASMGVKFGKHREVCRKLVMRIPMGIGRLALHVKDDMSRPKIRQGLLGLWDVSSLAVLFDVLEIAL